MYVNILMGRRCESKQHMGGSGGERRWGGERLSLIWGAICMLNIPNTSNHHHSTQKHLLVVALSHLFIKI